MDLSGSRAQQQQEGHVEGHEQHADMPQLEQQQLPANPQQLHVNLIHYVASSPTPGGSTQSFVPRQDWTGGGGGDVHVHEEAAFFTQQQIPLTLTMASSTQPMDQSEGHFAENAATYFDQPHQQPAFHTQQQQPFPQQQLGPTVAGNPSIHEDQQLVDTLISRVSSVSENWLYLLEATDRNVVDKLADAFFTLQQHRQQFRNIFGAGSSTHSSFSSLAQQQRGWAADYQGQQNFRNQSRTQSGLTRSWSLGRGGNRTGSYNHGRLVLAGLALAQSTPALLPSSARLTRANSSSLDLARGRVAVFEGLNEEQENGKIAELAAFCNETPTTTRRKLREARELVAQADAAARVAAAAEMQRRGSDE